MQINSEILLISSLILTFILVIYFFVWRSHQIRCLMSQISMAEEMYIEARIDNLYLHNYGISPNMFTITQKMRKRIIKMRFSFRKLDPEGWLDLKDYQTLYAYL